jgi:hypothetical protein
MSFFIISLAKEITYCIVLTSFKQGDVGGNGKRKSLETIMDAR